jgi:hypothetical protein
MAVGVGAALGAVSGWAYHDIGRGVLTGTAVAIFAVVLAEMWNQNAQRS